MRRGITFLILALAGPLQGSGAGSDQALWQRLEKTAPEGFSLARPVQRYGTVERPLAGGTIFTFMDGGGVAYLEHGYVELLHAEYADGRGGEVVLDAFAFASAAQAREAFADERICPAGGMPLAGDPSGKVYRFPPDYFIYMAIGDRLVYLHVNDDRRGGMLDRFAAAVRSVIPEEDP